MKKTLASALLGLNYLLFAVAVHAQPAPQPTGVIVNTGELGFSIPSFSDILTFAIRAFFVIAGVAALFFLLLGALAWVTSGGNKENVEKAQQKIQQAVVGVILIAVVLAIVATLESVVFHNKICFGLTCTLTIPSLIK